MLSHKVIAGFCLYLFELESHTRYVREVRIADISSIGQI